MKILLLIPENYTILNTFKNAFERLGHQVLKLDYLSFFNKWQNRLIIKTSGLPFTVKDRLKFHHYYSHIINKNYLNTIYYTRPDMVLVYNSQYLNFKTASEIRKISKLVFFLGDNPFFMHSHQQDDIGMYINSDFIFSSDSFITEYFQRVGQVNVDEIFLGYDPKVCYPKKPNKDELIRYSHDLVMIGRLYPRILSPYNYKGILFYNQFVDRDIIIYGHNWGKHLEKFTELKKKVMQPDHYFSFDEVNTILSCCKVYPIDANPGIINGIHLRVFDCIGTGILPIVEHTKDIDKVFAEVKIPSIKDYTKSVSIADEYTNNDSLRERRIKELKDFTDSKYTPQIAVSKMLDKVFN